MAPLFLVSTLEVAAPEPPTAEEISKSVSLVILSTIFVIVEPALSINVIWSPTTNSLWNFVPEPRIPEPEFPIEILPVNVVLEPKSADKSTSAVKSSSAVSL